MASNLLRLLGNVATVGGAGLRGYAQDQETQAARVLAQAKAVQDAQNAAVLNRVRLGGIDPDLQARIAGAKANAEEPAKTTGAVNTARALAPIHTSQAIATAQGTEPIEVDKAVKIATQTPQAPSGTVLPGANGAPAQLVITGGKDTKHPVGSTMALPTVSKEPAGQGAGSAPMAAKVGQFGEMLKKAHDVFGAADQMDVTLGQSAANDVAQHGVHIPLLGTVPGSKGAGNLMLSNSPQYAQYQAALSPFILAAAHALSGARINQDQVEQIRRSIELAPGDFGNPQVRQQKEKNLIDLINSIGGSLPQDQITAQEGQMDPEAIKAMTSRGYRVRTGSTPQRRSTDGKKSADDYLRAAGIP